MALRPEQIAALRDACEELAEPISQWLLRDIAQRIAQAGRMTSTAAYELYRTRALGESKAALKEYLREQLKLTRREVRRLFRQAARFSHDADFDRLGIARKGYSESFEQTVAGGELSNLTKTLGMVDRTGKALPLQKAYRSAMDFAFSQVFSGAADTDTAVAMATRKMAAQGVRVIDYESGVHTGLEAAVRRNMLGGLGLLDEQVTQQNHDELGCNGWEISAHANSAPDHEGIQGRQYSDAEYTALNNSLARRIGTLNCGHLVFPVILGVNSPQYTKAELHKFREDNARGITYEGRHYTGYEATQKQRQLERAIWAQKNRILIAEATGDAERLQTAQIRLRMLERHYREFSRAAGLRTRAQRAQVAGFGSGQAARVSAAVKAAQANSFTQGAQDGNLRVTMESIKQVQTVPSVILNENAQERLAGVHKQLLAQVSKKPLGTEAAECYTLDMQRLAPISYGVPGAGRIRVPDFEQPYILAHNHPNGGTFSMGDIAQLLGRENLRVLTAVGNDGTVYSLEKEAGFNSHMADMMIRKIRAENPGWSNTPELHLKVVLEFLKGAEAIGLHYFATGN